MFSPIIYAYQLYLASVTKTSVHVLKQPGVHEFMHLKQLIIFSDMGHGLKDDTRQVLKLEQPSLNTTKNLISEMGAHDLIIDVGDISYADGYEPIVSSVLIVKPL